MTDESPDTETAERSSPTLPTRIALPFLVLVLATILVPSVRRMGDPYGTDHNGGLTAWFALMSQNMVEQGFAETRLLPTLNPDAGQRADLVYYVTHPVLDVVFRAGLMKALGTTERIARLPGLIGCLGLALLLFFILRRWLTPVGACCGAAFAAWLPIFGSLAHLSMHHPMTLFTAAAGALFFLRFRERGRLLDAIGMICSLGVSVQFDWPGYFMPLVLWIAAWLTMRPRFSGRGLVVLVGLPLLVALSLVVVWAHVDLIGGMDLRVALGNASGAPAAAATTPAPWRLFYEHQLHGFGGRIGLGVLALSPLVLIVRRARSGLWLAWILSVGYGVLNVAIFHEKAPYHSFWGCYWLPWAGLCGGVVAEGLLAGGRAVMPETLRARVPLLFLGLLGGALSMSVLQRPINEEPTKIGATHKQHAELILAHVPPEDRGLIVTNLTNYEYKVLLAYLRVNLWVAPLKPLELKSIRGELRKHFPHVRGQRCLFVVPSKFHPEGEIAREMLIAWMMLNGKLYKNLPGLQMIIFDLTEFVWGD